MSREMFTIDVKSFIKTIIYFSISLACFVFVFWQSVQCIEKYIGKPQGTKLSLQHTSEIPQFPAITICPSEIEDKYNSSELNRCGLRYDLYYIIYYTRGRGGTPPLQLNSTYAYLLVWMIIANLGSGLVIMKL